MNDILGQGKAVNYDHVTLSIGVVNRVRRRDKWEIDYLFYQVTLIWIAGNLTSRRAIPSRISKNNSKDPKKGRSPSVMWKEISNKV